MKGGARLGRMHEALYGLIVRWVVKYILSPRRPLTRRFATPSESTNFLAAAQTDDEDFPPGVIARA